MSNFSPYYSKAEGPARLINQLGWLAAQLMLWVFMATVVFPMLWTVFASLKTSPEIFNDPWGLPEIPQLQNYINAWTKMNAGTYIINSLIVSAGSLLFITGMGSMIAYVLARYEFPGNRFLYFFFISGMMIPGYLAFIPAWFLHRSLGLLDTYWSLIIQYTAFNLPFTIFMLYSFFKTLPKELEEAALVDGASLFTVFWKIMLPLSKSGLLTVSVFNFLGVWNEFTWALITISDETKKTLPLGAVNIMQQAKYATDWGAMFAGFVIILIPTFAVYILFQSKLTEGITIGALK
ncbi:MAG: carbohydrate ABC transporter permease [Anaerolineales bacterium]